jgi:hypothetical protein
MAGMTRPRGAEEQDLPLATALAAQSGSKG